MRFERLCRLARPLCWPSAAAVAKGACVAFLGTLAACGTGASGDDSPEQDVSFGEDVFDSQTPDAHSDTDASCVENDALCDGDTLVFCLAGELIEELCEFGCADARCASRPCPSPACTPDGRGVIACDESGVQRVSLCIDSVCSEGACDSLCDEAQTTCTPEGRVASCDGERTWSCPQPLSCERGECVPRTLIYTCENTDSVRVSDSSGEQVAVLPCGEDTRCEAGACVNTSLARCESFVPSACGCGGITVCGDGTISCEGGECPDCSIAGERCGACEEGVVRCVDGVAYCESPEGCRAVSLRPSRPENWFDHNIGAIRGSGPAWLWGDYYARPDRRPSNDRAQMVAWADNDDSTCYAAPGGRVSCVGNNATLQLGNPDPEQREGSFMLPETAEKITALQSGYCALAGGEVFCWGHGDLGALGAPGADDSSVPVRIDLPAGIRDIDSDALKAYALSESGDVYHWGVAADASEDVRVYYVASSVTRVPTPGPVVAMSVSWYSWLFVTLESGELVVARPVIVDQKHASDERSRVEVIDVEWEVFSGGVRPAWTSFDTRWGNRVTCGSDAAGDVTCLNRPSDGWFEDWDTELTAVPFNRALRALVAREGVFCALDDWGSVLCWGETDSGLIGDGGLRSRESPTLVRFPAMTP